MCVMPRFYFNIFDEAVSFDYQGAFLADERAAREHAVRAVQLLAAEAAQHGHLSGHHFVEYVDSAQNKLGEVRFGDVVGRAHMSSPSRP